ncbi:MAG: AAA family ATPase [Halodesulfurarchaeum sp.]
MASARDQELTDRFETFYREYRSDAIADLARRYPREAKSLEIDYEDLFRFDPDFADDLLETPRRFLDAAEEALRLYDLPVEKDLANAHVRVTNLPDPTEIRDIRAEHLGTLLAVQGIVRKATSVKPKIEQAAFECLRCGTITVVPQADGDFQDPYQCDGCEREGPFQFLTEANETEFVDAQKLRIQESPEGLGGGETPESIDMHIEDDITGDVSPGDHVTATGILRLDDSDIESTDSRVFDMYLEGVSVTIEDEEFEEMEISEAEREEIIRLSEESDIYERIIDSIAPTIYGFEVAKLAIALQLFSGVTKHLPDGARIRGDVHILLVGDPGTGKSQILQYIRHIAPRSVYTSGKGSSAAGLTAAAVRDDFGDGQQWSLEAGALVLADKGVAAVDELDKMACVTGETLVSLGNGEIERIGELAHEKAAEGSIEPLENGRTIRDVEGLSVETMTEDGSLEERPVTAIHEYEAPAELCEVTLESGESLTATPDHPFFVLEGEDRVEREASSLQTGDEVLVPQSGERVADGGLTAVGEGKTAGDRVPDRGVHSVPVDSVEIRPRVGFDEQPEFVYDLTVEGTHNFVANGMVVHNSDDRSAMHEALEQQSISISKAGINATLKSRCALLGAANPELGRFDRYETPANQIDLEPALISRFDLIFTVTDQPDEEKDANLAEHILNTNYAGELNTHRTKVSTSNVSANDVDKATESVSPAIDPDIMRKYIAYARSTCFPTMTDAAESRIREFYVDLRSQGTGEDSPVPVTARKLEAIVRLAEASARVRLSDTVEPEDAERALDIVETTLKEIGMDPETGQYDADVIETGQSKSQRDRIRTIKELIAEIESEFDEGAPIEEVLARAEEIEMDRAKAEHEIEKLKTQGEVYEPTTEHLRTT